MGLSLVSRPIWILDCIVGFLDPDVIWSTNRRDALKIMYGEGRIPSTIATTLCACCDVYRFAEFDGATLLEFQSMRLDAPEAFFADLRSDGLSRKDRLKLSRALRDLV